MKRIVLFVLLVAFVLPTSLVGCKNKPESPSTESVVSTEIDDNVADIVGFESSDHDGREFTILVSESDAEEHLTKQGLTGYVVNDTVYERNLAVNEYFGITLNVVSRPGGWAAKDDFIGEIEKSIAGGIDGYDMIVGVTGVISASYSSGFYVDAAHMNYIDLEKSWWMNNQFEELNIHQKMYGIYGDMNLSLYGEIHAIMFNSQLIKIGDMESPYDLVADKEWTLEKMLTMAADADEDKDAKPGINPQSDIMGMIGTINPNRAFMTAFNLDLIERDGDGNFALVETPSERYIDAYNTLCGAFFGGEYNYLLEVDVNTDDYSVALKAMAEDRCLFLPSYVKWISDIIIRDMEGMYGIVPYPMLDEDQKEYRSQVATGATVTCFPLNMADAELSAQVATYMSYLGYDTVVAKYYDEYLGDRLSTSPEMLEMLQLVRETSIMSPSIAYSSAFEQPVIELFEVSYRIHYGYGGMQGLTSMYGRRIGTYKTELKTLMKSYE